METFGFLIILGTVAGIVCRLAGPALIKNRLNRHQSQPEQLQDGTGGWTNTTMPGESVCELRKTVRAAHNHGHGPTMAAKRKNDPPSLSVTFSTQGSIMTATLDEDQPSLPVIFATPRPTLRAPWSRHHNQLDLTLPRSGDALAFWALMDQATRVWLNRHEVRIEARRVSVTMSNSRFSPLTKITSKTDRHARTSAAITDLMTRLLAPNHAEAFLRILTPEQPTFMRRRALDDWFDGDYRNQITTVAQPPPSAPPTAEWLWVMLDRGRLPTSQELATMLVVKREEPGEIEHQQNLVQMVMQRQNPAGRQAVLQRLLQAPAMAEEVSDVLFDYRHLLVDEELIAAYRKTPAAVHLLRFLKVAEQTDIIAFLIEVLRNGERPAQKEAAKRLADQGNRSALFALDKARKSEGIAFERAYTKLAKRLSTRPRDAGSISPAAVGAVDGAVSIATAGAVSTSPAPAKTDAIEPDPHRQAYVGKSGGIID